MQAMYYGVWINVGEDIYIGTPVVDTAREVKALLLSNGVPEDGDNLSVFTGEGRLDSSFDSSGQGWRLED